MKKSVILMSGGLDSIVALGSSIDEYGIDLALTFDYGQKSAKTEINASKKISDYYGIKHKIIKLDWLKEITTSALVSSENIPSENLGTRESAALVWVPNRNGLFLNIAASIADGEDYDCIIIGANKEEGENFPDNTVEFIDRVNKEFEYSTLKKPKVAAPLINLNKNDIVKLALDNVLPLDMIYSCYALGDRHCGKCESCIRLKNALKANNDEYFTGKLF